MAIARAAVNRLEIMTENKEKSAMTQENKSDKKTEKTRMRSRLASLWKEHRLLSIVGLLFILLVLYRGGRSFLTGDVVEEDPPVNVKVTQAVLAPIDLISPVTGRLQPEEEVAIVPLAQGQVTAVHVSVGQQVTAGQVLFEIDKGQVSASYIQAKEAYDAVSATFSRIELLYSEGAVSRQDYESARTQYISAREAFRAAADAYANFTVTSPIDGIVTSMNVTVGGLAGGAPAASVANASSLVIETSVGEALAPYVEVGDPVSVYVESLAAEYPGLITSFSPIPSLGMLTYPLTITLEDDPDLFAGMFAEVRLVSRRIEDALTVPSEAVIVRGGRPVVAVLDDENRPTLVEVTVGVDNGVMAEVLSGLSEGDRIVYSGQHFITPGVEVRVVEEE